MVDDWPVRTYKVNTSFQLCWLMCRYVLQLHATSTSTKILQHWCWMGRDQLSSQCRWFRSLSLNEGTVGAETMSSSRWFQSITVLRKKEYFRTSIHVEIVINFRLRLPLVLCCAVVSRRSCGMSTKLLTVVKSKVSLSCFLLSARLSNSSWSKSHVTVPGFLP